MKTVELRSTQQPRAAVPTWSGSNYGLATALGDLFRARQRAHRGADSSAHLLHLSGVEAGQSQRRTDRRTGDQSRDGQDPPSQVVALPARMAEGNPCLAFPAAY